MLNVGVLEGLRFIVFFFRFRSWEGVGSLVFVFLEFIGVSGLWRGFG